MDEHQGCDRHPGVKPRIKPFTLVKQREPARKTTKAAKRTVFRAMPILAETALRRCFASYADNESLDS
jgi:hypothetical protein